MTPTHRFSPAEPGPPARAGETSRRIVVVLLLASFAAVAACTSAPSQEMSDARQAISAAREADAETYAPRSFDSAERLLGNARQSLEAGRYDLARDDAVAARDAAMQARVVSVVIGEARAALREAPVTSASRRRSEMLLEAAEAAAREGDEARALELARRARRELP